MAIGTISAVLKLRDLRHTKKTDIIYCRMVEERTGVGTSAPVTLHWRIEVVEYNLGENLRRSDPLLNAGKRLTVTSHGAYRFPNPASPPSHKRRSTVESTTHPELL